MSVCCLLFLRLQRKVVSLCVYREGDWLRLEGVRARYDCINTLVIMDNVDAGLPYAAGHFISVALYAMLNFNLKHKLSQK